METKAVVIVDLGYGDAGKGSTTDALARRLPSPPIVVRYNGGPQCAHNVVTSHGKHHTFAQFGSASFVPEAETYLSRFMLVNPIAMLTEAQHLESLGLDWKDRLHISEQARVITPYHRALNRLRETARGVNRHGSTGHGVGETMKMDLVHPELTLRAGNITRRGIEQVRDYCYEQALKIVKDSKVTMMAGYLEHFDHQEFIEVLLAAARDAFNGRLVDEDWLSQHFDRNLIFEGAHGVLLDEWHGFHPYTTWSTTTTENAVELLQGYPGEVEVLGLMRSYMTRHGAGPFVTEEYVESLMGEPHNTYGEWTGRWRVGWADLVAYRYAKEVAGTVTSLGMTFTDRISARQPVAISYRGFMPKDLLVKDRIIPGPVDTLDRQERITHCLERVTPVYHMVPGKRYPEWMADQLELPLRMLSSGPTAQDKEWR